VSSVRVKFGPLRSDPDVPSGNQEGLARAGAQAQASHVRRNAAEVSSRYERASLIVTSNKPFSAWGEIFGDEVVAAAMIDRLVHHAEILSLKGDSYRLRDRDLGGRLPAREPETA
jgi:hypothetical protein